MVRLVPSELVIDLLMSYGSNISVSHIWLDHVQKRPSEETRVGWSPHGVKANMLDSYIVVSKFKLKSHYYICF